MSTSTTAVNGRAGVPTGIGASAQNIVNITPSDSNDLAIVGVGFSVNVSGNVTLNDYGNGGANIHSSQVVYAIAGYVYPGCITKVWDTGTTATGITIWY
jgi:hypothetical protein